MALFQWSTKKIRDTVSDAKIKNATKAWADDFGFADLMWMFCGSVLDHNRVAIEEQCCKTHIRKRTGACELFVWNYIRDLSRI